MERSGRSLRALASARHHHPHVQAGKTAPLWRSGGWRRQSFRCPTDSCLEETKSEWKIIGKGVKRLDTVEKLSGRQIFAIDVQLPDMLNATIAQSPVFGGKLVSFDAHAISDMPGVRHVMAVGDNAVAVVADKFYQAKTAMAKLPIVWDEAGNGQLNSASIAAIMQRGA